MPSPFPGMDPFLEDPNRWPNVHHGLITFLGAELNKILPAGYAAAVEERIYVEYPERPVVPDVLVVQSSLQQSHSQGGMAVATEIDAPTILSIPYEEYHEGYIQILRLKRADTPERVITVIEVLSHANKTKGSDGRVKYLQKQRETLNSDVHLLELDMLRHGQYTVAPPFEYAKAKLGNWDYLISLSRYPSRWQFELWPVRMSQRLPHIALPLAGDDPDVSLDLQAIFNQCYDSGPYSRRVDYNAEPYFPFEGEEAVWADTLLREKRIRKN